MKANKRELTLDDPWKLEEQFLAQAESVKLEKYWEKASNK